MMYNTIQEQKENLLAEVEKLHQRHELAGTVGVDYFEPGMMEYLEQSDGVFDKTNGEMLVRFEVKGTRYEGRTEQIEKVKTEDSVQIVRDCENPYNPNNFMILTEKGKNLGNMPAQLCNVIAPLFDGGNLTFVRSEVSFVEPISKRSRHAKQAVLFVELTMNIRI
jgi:hypothetical protein